MSAHIVTHAVFRHFGISTQRHFRTDEKRNKGKEGRKDKRDLLLGDLKKAWEEDTAKDLPESTLFKFTVEQLNVQLIDDTFFPDGEALTKLIQAHDGFSNEGATRSTARSCRKPLSKCSPRCRRTSSPIWTPQ